MSEKQGNDIDSPSPLSKDQKCSTDSESDNDHRKENIQHVNDNSKEAIRKLYKIDPIDRSVNLGLPEHDTMLAVQKVDDAIYGKFTDQTKDPISSIHNDFLEHDKSAGADRSVAILDPIIQKARDQILFPIMKKAKDITKPMPKVQLAVRKVQPVKIANQMDDQLSIFNFLIVLPVLSVMAKISINERLVNAFNEILAQIPRVDYQFNKKAATFLGFVYDHMKHFEFIIYLSVQKTADGKDGKKRRTYTCEINRLSGASFELPLFVDDLKKGLREFFLEDEIKIIHDEGDEPSTSVGSDHWSESDYSDDEDDDSLDYFDYLQLNCDLPLVTNWCSKIANGNLEDQLHILKLVSHNAEDPENLAIIIKRGKDVVNDVLKLMRQSKRAGTSAAVCYYACCLIEVVTRSIEDFKQFTLSKSNSKELHATIASVLQEWFPFKSSEGKNDDDFVLMQSQQCTNKLLMIFHNLYRMDKEKYSRETIKDTLADCLDAKVLNDYIAPAKERAIKTRNDLNDSIKKMSDNKETQNMQKVKNREEGRQLAHLKKREKNTHGLISAFDFVMNL